MRSLPCQKAFQVWRKDVIPVFGILPENIDFRANVVRAGLNYKFDWYRPFVTR